MIHLQREAKRRWGVFAQDSKPIQGTAPHVKIESPRKVDLVYVPNLNMLERSSNSIFVGRAVNALRVELKTLRLGLERLGLEASHECFDAIRVVSDYPHAVGNYGNRSVSPPARTDVQRRSTRVWSAKRTSTFEFSECLVREQPNPARDRGKRATVGVEREFGFRI